MMDHPLIPGLIDDLGRECLIRIHFQGLPTATAVCKTWKSEINFSEFRRLRKASGITRPVIVVAQANAHDPNQNPGHGPKQNPPRPEYRINLFDTVSGTWAELPGIPELPEGLLKFSGLVGLDSDLVVIGGWDPLTCRASESLYVYSFLSGKWRRGSDMPGVRRSFFGCASDHDRMVVIAGGHDEDKNALRSAFLYDVVEDKWVPLPDMERERDECKVIFHRGRFHVISGYPTDTQGSFTRTAEVLDPATWQWGPVIEEFLEESATSSSWVACSDGRVYSCTGPQNADVALQQGDKWQVVAKVPADVRSSQWVATSGNKLMVIGSPKIGEPSNGYMLDLKDYKRTTMDMPKDYSGHVQSGCVMEL